MNWNEKLDTLQKNLGIETDMEMAKVLGISKSALSQIKSGKNEFGMITKLIILDKLGYQSLRDSLLKVVPKEKREIITKKNNEIYKKRLHKKIKKEKDA